MCSAQPQSFFEISPALRSPSHWQGAIIEMAAMNSAEQPLEKLRVLLRAAKAIFAIFAAEKSMRPPDGPDVLGADDFIPVFNFVLTHADLETPLYEKECMWNLCNPDMIAGEGGYYLTVFDASLEFLRRCEPATLKAGESSGSLDAEYDDGDVDYDADEHDEVIRSLSVIGLT